MTNPYSKAQATTFPVSSGYLRIIARMLCLQERELPRLLAGTGLPIEVLMPGDETYLSGRQLVRILENGQGIMGGPDFGIALGKQLSPDAHGPIGYLSLASPDLLSSLRALADYLPARLGVVDLQITLDDKWLTCSYQILETTPDHIRQYMCEAFALSVQSQVETILRRAAVEAEISFTHSEPCNAAAYSQSLNGQFLFDQPVVRYRLPAELAHTANTGGDSEAFRVTKERCDKLLAQQPAAGHSVADCVRRLLLTQPQGSVSEDQIARALFVSKRTLARRLKQENIGYRTIRESVLRELACQALQDSSQSVESIAVSLGYNDSAAFRKAFRRWTGSTPRSFRG